MCQLTNIQYRTCDIDILFSFLFSAHLQVLTKEAQKSLVAALILLLDSIVAQVGTGSHPAVNLIFEDLNVLRYLECVLELLDILGGLVAGSQQGNGDVDALGVGRIDHGRVDRGNGPKGVVVCLGG